jgi:hypothetical protein
MKPEQRIEVMKGIEEDHGPRLAAFVQAASTPGAGFEKRGSNYDDKVREINAKYAYVRDIHRVISIDGSDIKPIKMEAFKTWFGNQKVMVGKKPEGLGDYWLEHRERRHYEGIEFDPTGGGKKDHYNLWKGFIVQPKEGDCHLFLEHLRDNVAKKDIPTFNWILGWFAQIFQQPHDKIGTSLVLRGLQGVGKTKVGEVMGSLIGKSHYMLVASPRYITGQFNAHMASLLLLHADEAFWAGDKKSEGLLKDLITGNTHPIEYKGVDPIVVKNYVRLFVTGNSDWIVPAGMRERRFAVFDVGEDKIRDIAYFAAIDEEMNKGGREALMKYLLEFDLSRINLRQVPRTAALLDQQLESLTPEQAWWFETLMKGLLPGGRNYPTNTCIKTALFHRYVNHARLRLTHRKSLESTIGKLIGKWVGPTLDYNKRHQLTARRRYEGDITKRFSCYVLPALKECREKFAKELEQVIEWEKPEGEGMTWEDQVWEHDDDLLVEEEDIIL